MPISQYMMEKIHRILADSIFNAMYIKEWPRIFTDDPLACEVAYLRTTDGVNHCLHIEIVREMAMFFGRYDMQPGYTIMHDEGILDADSETEFVPPRSVTTGGTELLPHSADSADNL